MIKSGRWVCVKIRNGESHFTSTSWDSGGGGIFNDFIKDRPKESEIITKYAWRN